MKKGKFIVIEGLDGSGKTTQIKQLTAKLKTTGERVYETFEPTDSPIGSLIRQIMMGRITADERTIAALFAADRIDHLTNPINGLLEKINRGIHVISDRYYFSSYAYHGVHLSMDWVIHTNSICADALKPDVNIFLDIPPSKCLERIQKNRFHLELYEKEKNMTNVYAKYMEAFSKLNSQEKILIINADRDPDSVASDIWENIQTIFSFSSTHSTTTTPSITN